MRHCARNSTIWRQDNGIRALREGFMIENARDRQPEAIVIARRAGELVHPQRLVFDIQFGQPIVGIVTGNGTGGDSSSLLLVSRCCRGWRQVQQLRAGLIVREGATNDSLPTYRSVTAAARTYTPAQI